MSFDAAAESRTDQPRPVIEPLPIRQVCSCTASLELDPMSTRQSLVVLARGGYAARGVIYLIIGIFALLAAQDSTKPKDSHRSLEALLSQPFGYVLVGLVVAGLLAFAGWRVLQATRDVDHHGKKFKGLVIRAGLLVGGVVNGALAFFALGLLISELKSSGSSGGEQTKDYWRISCLGNTQTYWFTSSHLYH